MKTLLEFIEDEKKNQKVLFETYANNDRKAQREELQRRRDFHHFQVEIWAAYEKWFSTSNPKMPELIKLSKEKRLAYEVETKTLDKTIRDFDKKK